VNKKKYRFYKESSTSQRADNKSPLEITTSDIRREVYLSMTTAIIFQEEKDDDAPSAASYRIA
jgi:hypothetical protein